MRKAKTEFDLLPSSWKPMTKTSQVLCHSRYQPATYMLLIHSIWPFRCSLTFTCYKGKGIRFNLHETKPLPTVLFMCSHLSLSLAYIVFHPLETFKTCKRPAQIFYCRSFSFFLLFPWLNTPRLLEDWSPLRKTDGLLITSNGMCNLGFLSMLNSMTQNEYVQISEFYFNN